MRPGPRGGRSRPLVLAGVLAALGAALPPAEAIAQPAPSGEEPSPGDKKAAGAKFAEGERAFAAGDFTTAAAAFEVAYRLAPHPSASWNAARARERAGEPARAANLYARYLREAPADAPDRQQAAASLAALTPNLGRVEISAAGEVAELSVDGERADATTVYVTPGTHVVRGVIVGTAVTKETPMVAAGAIVTVALVAGVAPGPAAPTASAPAPPSTEPDAAPVPARGRKGWHPAVPIVSGSVSLLFGALTVWSGLDTLEKKDELDAILARRPYEQRDADEARKALDAGKLAQGRTNLLGATAIAGALFTLVAAVALVDWSDPDEPQTKPSARIGIGPGGAALRGSF